MGTFGLDGNFEASGPVPWDLITSPVCKDEVSLSSVWFVF